MGCEGGALQEASAGIYGSFVRKGIVRSFVQMGFRNLFAGVSIAASCLSVESLSEGNGGRARY